MPRFSVGDKVLVSGKLQKDMDTGKLLLQTGNTLLGKTLTVVKANSLAVDTEEGSRWQQWEGFNISIKGAKVIMPRGPKPKHRDPDILVESQPDLFLVKV